MPLEVRADLAVFVSHSSRDSSFVRLLARLLEFHGVDYWYSARRLRGGDRFPAEIQAAVQSADILLLVASESALQSQWVAHEIKSFRQARPSGRVIPLILSEMAAEKIAQFGIQDFQYIRFDDCLLNGFEALFQLFGQDFLKPRLTPRGPDRRVSSTRQRLRYAFWQRYHELSGHGKFEELDLRYSQIQKLIEALRLAAGSFTFTAYEDHSPQSTEQLIESAVQEVCRELRDSKARAVIVVESVAELLWERYDIQPVERRRLRGLGASTGTP